MTKNIGKEENKTKLMLELVRNLPLFSIKDIPNIGIADSSVRIKLYRLVKAGKITRIKRGVYVHTEYVNHIRSAGTLNTYLEFLATNIYEPAYLSTEYVLQKYGILSESVQAITVITTNKKNRFINSLGMFTYRQINKNLFAGFSLKEKNDLMISTATVAKALFDFLYLRKNILKNENAFRSLRLNLNIVSVRDLKEFKKYVNKENSKKMHLLASFVEKYGKR